jgi:hypothetical protein
VERDLRGDGSVDLGRELRRADSALIRIFGSLLRSCT